MGVLPEIVLMVKQFAGNPEILPQWVSNILFSAIRERDGIKQLAEKERTFLYAFFVFGKVLKRYNI